MALTYRIIKATLSSEGVLIHDGIDNAIGLIRLWNDDIKQPTDLYIVIFEDILQKDRNKGNAIRSGDTVLLNNKINQILQNAQVQLTDYGLLQKRSFHCDIFIPASILANYTG